MQLARGDFPRGAVESTNACLASPASNENREQRRLNIPKIEEVNALMKIKTQEIVHFRDKSQYVQPLVTAENDKIKKLHSEVVSLPFLLLSGRERGADFQGHDDSQKSTKRPRINPSN